MLVVREDHWRPFYNLGPNLYSKPGKPLDSYTTTKTLIEATTREADTTKTMTNIWKLRPSRPLIMARKFTPTGLIIIEKD